MWAGMSDCDFQKRGMQIKSLLPKTDEVSYNANKTNASIIGMYETKLDETSQISLH